MFGVVKRWLERIPLSDVALTMLSHLRNALPSQSLPRYVRSLTQATLAQPVQYPYFIPRNTDGNLPVYTDIRNGGTRFLVTIRNVDGKADLLAKDLADSLFENGSREASKLKIEITRSRNLVISGGRWKNQVVEWLMGKGF